MLIVDDILLFPMRSLLFIFKEIHKTALEEIHQQAENIRQELSALYLKLESGELTESEFDEREADLLDRLDELEAIEDDSESSEDDSESTEDDSESADKPEEM